MQRERISGIDSFFFRDLHPLVSLGTASDRYAGWMGQIYSKGRYEGRISSRRKKIKGTYYTEKVLPVESVEEYFEHFSVLELDFTFYAPLLDRDGNFTRTWHVLNSYAGHLREGNRVILKVPQTVFARSLRRGKGQVENEHYLDSEMFIRQFYEPACLLFDRRIEAFVFEQEYQLASVRPMEEEFAGNLGRFFEKIPQDNRYHVEIRTQALLSDPVIKTLKDHGIGYVLSHWTWLPSLKRQFSLMEGAVFNRSGSSVVRLMTPRGMRYEDAYKKAHPFDRLVEGMLGDEMLNETVDIMKGALDNNAGINVVINNRSGGNAPLIAREIASRFLDITGAA